MLICLSGLLSDETIWTDALAELTGYGPTTTRCFPAFDSIGAMAKSVLETAPTNFALAGHSMGGRVALEVARRAPERVMGLALLNTGVHGCRDHEPTSRGRLVELARTSGMSAVAAEWLPPMMGASPNRVAEILPRLIRMVERNTPEGFAAQTQALLGRPDASGVLALLHMPTLLLSGSADTWSPVTQHEEMRRQIRDARLVVVESAGHMAPVEQPSQVAAALRNWLERLGAPAGT